MESPLQTLIHASLGVHSLLKRSPLKPNVIDRDKIVVPPNWDSWGKIRVLRDGFDVEAVAQGWAIDLDQDFLQLMGVFQTNGVVNDADREDAIPDPDDAQAPEPKFKEPEGSAVVLYEKEVQDTTLDALALAQGNQDSTKLEAEPVDTQAFLASQVSRLEAEKKADEQAGKDYSNKATAAAGTDEVISDHIGPVQFNMGGIQVDADDMVQRLKVCESCFLALTPANGINRTARPTMTLRLGIWKTRTRSRQMSSRATWRPSGWHSSLAT
jgi:dynein light intermediate chain 1, cytosolic